MTLELVNHVKGHRIPSSFLKSHLKKAFSRKYIGRFFSKRDLSHFSKNQILRIVFVDQTTIRRLNKQYRNKNKTTDILSFDLEEPGVLGELAVCMSVIQKQASQYQVPVREELLFLVLHGVLHLLGYDHEHSEDEATRMFRLQTSLFRALRPRSSGNRQEAFSLQNLV